MEPVRAVRIRNFQSLKDVEVELGNLTVIVGKSNSGKSAVVRALRAVARNVNSPAAVRVGSKKFDVTASIGDLDVSIERGKAQSTYRISDHSDDTEEVYTKSGRTVPDEVAKVLNLPVLSGEDLSFATQLDPPYLLSQSPSQAASTLGDLSNVSRLHDAAREANRLRLEADRMVKVRTSDLTGIKTQIEEEFGTIREEKERVTEARAMLTEVRSGAEYVESLGTLLERLVLAETAADDLNRKAAELSEPADIDSALLEVEQRVKGIKVLDKLLHAAAESLETANSATEEAEKLAAIEVLLAKEYHDILEEAGTCPTCGQATTDLTSHSHTPAAN